MSAQCVNIKVSNERVINAASCWRSRESPGLGFAWLPTKASMLSLHFSLLAAGMSSWSSCELVVSGSFPLAQQPTQEQLSRIQNALSADNAPAGRNNSPARPYGVTRLSGSSRLGMRDDDRHAMLSMLCSDGPEADGRTLDALAVVDRWASGADRR